MHCIGRWSDSSHSPAFARRLTALLRQPAAHYICGCAAASIAASIIKLHVDLRRFRFMNSMPRSLVWDYFTASDKTSATCNLCKKSFKRPSANTSNLMAHLQRDHRQEHQEMREAEDRCKTETNALKQICKTLTTTWKCDRIYLLFHRIFIFTVTC